MLRSNIVTFSDTKPKMLTAIGSPRLLTLFIAAVCMLLFVLRIASSDISVVCFLPSRVITRFEIYRIFTGPFFHGGLLHILFNIVAWMFIGKDYEKAVGTLPAAYSVFILLIPLIASLHCCAAYLIDALAETHARNQCTIGISGVLFALLVVNIEASAVPSISVFGLFSLPSRWYPWLLALVLQLLSPNLSFLGHLSGIALGYAISFGYLHRLTPSESRFATIEESWGLTSLPLWLPATTAMSVGMMRRPLLPQTDQSQASSISGRMRAGWSGMTSWFSRSTETSSQTFSGHGRPLGGESSSPPMGRVPPTSRLLQEAEKKNPDSQTTGATAGEGAFEEENTALQTEGEAPLSQSSTEQ